MILFGSKESKIARAAAKKNTKFLIKMLNDSDKNVVIKAMEGLSTIQLDDDAFNILIPHLRNQDASLRAAAAKAVGTLGNAHGKAHLAFQLQNEKDPAVREVIQEAMTKLKSE